MKKNGTTAELENTEEQPKGKNFSYNLSERLLEKDLEGMFKNHSDTGFIFDKVLKLLITVESIPFLTIAVLLSSEAMPINALSDLRALPPIVSMVLLFSSILGLLGIQVMIHTRLDILMYARAINRFREHYVKTLKKNGISFEPVLPITIEAPIDFEPIRPTGILVIAFSIINATYLSIAIGNFIKGICNEGLIVTGVVIAALNYIAYYLITKRKAVPGDRRKLY